MGRVGELEDEVFNLREQIERDRKFFRAKLVELLDALKGTSQFGRVAGKEFCVRSIESLLESKRFGPL